ncbi:MAG: short-chain dehydrogenase [Gammaproteobacteria bacterium]|nr:MAG: short-chain dehydrogenase [Gammaproteobacteria bacterium]RLA10820.1 MAG: short-chain dehydrogenase [Gammaproteobacteria bacterium]
MNQATNRDRLNNTGNGFSTDLLNGQVALVSGGGSGIGRATALQLARCGAQVVVMGRREAPLLQTCELIAEEGYQAIALTGDTREIEQIEPVLAAIDEQFGQLNLLVNNAGGQFVSAAKDISPKGFEAVIRNNLIGTWNMTKLVADRFMFDQGGRVICITAAVKAGFAGFAHTAAARSGVASLIRTLAVEWAEYGIRLNCVAPGTIETSGMGQYPIPSDQWTSSNRNLLGHLGEPNDIANMVVYLASPMAKFITGEEFYVDGGETLHLGHDAREMIDPEMFKKRQRADQADPTR